MARPRDPRPVALSARAYGWLLRLYPAAFRRAYGRDMAQVFRDACLDAHARAGAWGVLLLWCPILRDLAANAAGEHVAALRGREGGLELMTVEGRAGRSVLLWWIIAGVLGWGMPRLPSLLPHGGPAYQGTYGADAVLNLATQGLVLGLAQWLIVRRYMPRAGWWVPATIVAAVLIAAATVVAYEGGGYRSFFVRNGIGTLVEGLALGMAQWLVLRRHVTRAGWWVVASAAGWLAAVFLTMVIFRLGLGALPMHAWRSVVVVSWAAGGALYGALLGRVLIALLRASPAASAV